MLLAKKETPLSVAKSFGAFIAFTILASHVLVFFDVLVPAVTIGLLLGWVILVFFVLAHIRPSLRVIAAATLIVIAILFPENRFHNQFPGFADLSVDETGVATSLYRTGNRSPTAIANGKLLDSVSTLEAWRKRVLEGFDSYTYQLKGRKHPSWVGARKPKLIVIATSGGAYRAAFWTTLVLDRLSSHEIGLPYFSESVRLLTGASGGMVGAAYYAALTPESGPRYKRITDALLRDICNSRSRFPEECGGGVEVKDPHRMREYRTAFPPFGDSLGPIAQQLVQRDMVRFLYSQFVPSAVGDWWFDWCTWGDRGLVLERQGFL